MMEANLVKISDNLDGKLSGKLLRGAVLISTGAGGTMDTPLLLKTAERLNDQGFLTLRWNFGFIQSGRAASAGGKREIPEMELAINFLKQQSADTPIILIGKSFGARLSTYIGAERDDISGYVFYGLPLVGAGKNAKVRDWSHLGKLKGKVLFITGEKDKLCPLPNLLTAQKFLTTDFDSTVVNGDHSFKPRGEDRAVERCVEWVKDSF
jgi:predicted alpha/beta-hydrolase family hydrolase